MPIQRIALNTGGGDAPGLNAVIRAVVLSALNRGWECLGIIDGYNGIMRPEEYPNGWYRPLTRDSVRGITHVGGTIVGTTNRGNPMSFPRQGPDGSWQEVDRTSEVAAALQSAGIDALVAIGGDGSLSIAHALAQKGVRVVGVPKTIDNDLDETVATFGFDTAVAVATECLDRLHSTAESHQRVMVVEVMGRYAGWIALFAGVAATADVILIPEIAYDINQVAAKVKQRDAAGRKFSIVVVAEGAKPRGGVLTIQGKAIGQAERLGGVGHKVAAALEELTGKEARVVQLGHLLRGGTPTATDRLLSLRFGAAAVRALAEGYSNIMVALDPPTVRYVPLERVAGRMKTVPLDCDTMLTARELGISFGD
ncbi:MAG: ATP-dependent 6-phosphofructokinase [Chloroflexi bacterium]|nr:ATP-dependent 6-phosphofructokinase [Chloroflexota bacterium]MBP8057396.1 ATP-dependent 6-phosphofructokinase [Chloroflexota bacterium]